ncbi:MAG: phenylalanine--tRNA ligase subunit beta [Thermodesulfovibrionales bacterium]|nr:phenylalanine--tRNA ligase subunit beta [Thermodesulfovibrionales bacterium]
MRVPLQWLNEFIDSGLSVKELAHRLTMAGLEVEAIEGGTAPGERATSPGESEDCVFEVNVTPNRPDCLSILGIAREVSAITGRPVKFPEHTVGGEDFGFEVEIKDEELCSRYAGRVIKDITIAASPESIRKRLQLCGVRPANNIVDITNYVLFELGQPLHAFDLNALKGKKIIVDKAPHGISIVTLDGSERKPTVGSLLIWDEERPVAVAGVMGGKETEVTESTKNIFLESAWFYPGSVRRTSKTLGLSSESSYRFERGVDIEMVEIALERAAFLMNRFAGGRVGKKIDVYPRRFVPCEIKVSAEKVNRILGTDMPASEMLDC